MSHQLNVILNDTLHNRLVSVCKSQGLSQAEVTRAGLVKKLRELEGEEE